MSEKSAGKPVTKTQEATVDNEAAKKKTKYNVTKLRENSMRLFNVTTSTFDGAMYGHKETEMTIAEAGSIINKWLGGKER